MVENAVLVETDAGVIEDLDWSTELLTSIIISDLTEEVGLVCENLLTWEVSWFECVRVVQFRNEVDKLSNCLSNLAVIVSLEEVKTETRELGEGVPFSPEEVTEDIKEDLSRYPGKLPSRLPFKVEKVPIDGTSYLWLRNVDVSVILGADSDDVVGVSRERAMFEVTLEFLIWLVDISSISGMVLEP